jgi:hypothetical protein
MKKKKIFLSLTLKSFGAVGDGVTDDTAAVESALTGGNIIVDGEGLTYLVSSTINTGSNIVFTNADFILDAGVTNESVFSASGTLSADDTPTATINEGDYTISVADESIYNEGDYIYIRSQRYWSPTTLDDVKYGEIVRVKDTSASTLSLYFPVLLEYTSADSFTINKITPVQNVYFENVNGLGVDNNNKFCDFRYCENVVLRDCNTVDFDNAHFAFTTCVNYKVVNATMDKTGVQDGLNYGVVHANGCFNGQVLNSTASRMRHLSTIGGSHGVSRFINVIECIGTAMTDAGIDAHSAVYEHSFLNNEVTLSDDSDTTQDGIISQGGKPTIKDNKIHNARRHGVFWQPSLSTDTANPIKGDIVNNDTYYNQTTTGTAYAILVTTPTNNTRKIDGLYTSGNSFYGGFVTSAMQITAVGAEIENIIINNNSFNGVPSARGIHIVSTSKKITNVSIIGNQISAGTNEVIYLQGNATNGIKNVMLSSNITKDGSIGFRCNYVTNLNTVGNMYIDYSSANRLIQNTTNHIALDS